MEAVLETDVTEKAVMGLTRAEREKPDNSPVKAAINLAHLQHALNVVAPAIPRGNAMIPVLQSVRLEQLPEGLAIEATDLTIAIRALVPETSGLAHPIVIPAEKFSRWVHLLAGDDLKLTATDRRATLRCGRIQAMVPILSASAWPDNQIYKLPEQAITLPQGVLARALKFAAIAISKEESRYTLNGALLVADGTVLRLVATDGHRMAIYTAPCAERITCLLPDSLIEALLPLLGSDDASVDLAQNESLIVASVAAETPVLISCHKITGSFPNWDAVVPKEKRTEVSAGSKAFLASLERCALMSSSNTQAVKLTFGAGQILIESSDAESGEAQESVDCIGSPDKPLCVGANAGYLIQLLKRVDGDIRIELPKAAEAPLLFNATPHDGETLDYVVMPLRLPK